MEKLSSHGSLKSWFRFYRFERVKIHYRFVQKVNHEHPFCCSRHNSCHNAINHNYYVFFLVRYLFFQLNFCPMQICRNDNGSPERILISYSFKITVNTVLACDRGHLWLMLISKNRRLNFCSWIEDADSQVMYMMIDDYKKEDLMLK